MLLVLLPLFGICQLNHAGKNFFVTLGADLAAPYAGKYEVKLTSKHHATVQFYYTNNALTTTYTLLPGEVKNIELSSFEGSLMTNSIAEVVDNRSLQITSDSNINVVVICKQRFSDDGMCIYPTDNQLKADEYYLLSLRTTNNAFGFFSIVSSCDSVVLEITPKAASVNHPAHVPYVITLNKGQTYKLGSVTDTSDMSGTRVRVLNNPAAVPVNIFCVFTAVRNYGTCCADALLEQLLPTSQWVKSYPVALMYHNKKILVRVVSSSPGNQVYIDGVPYQVLGAGEVAQFFLTQSSVVSAQMPVGVAQFMLSNAWTVPTSGFGDPEMLWVLPPSSGTTESYFRVSNPVYTTSFPTNPDRTALTVISDSGNVNSITLDGNNIGSYFQAFPGNPSWMYAFVKVDSSDTLTNHHLVSAKKVSAYFCKVYSQGSQSYILGDVQEDSVALYSIAEIKQDTVYKCKGIAVSLSASCGGPFFWSTGDTTAMIQVMDTGTYFVRGSIQKNCYILPAFNYFVVVDTQAEILNSVVYDTLTRCEGQSVVLTAGPALYYEWSDGSSQQQVTVTDGDSWYVKEWTSDAPCEKQYNLHHFYIRQYAFSFALQHDTTACEGDKVKITSAYAGTSWSTGENGPAIYVSVAGTYIGSYTDSCGKVHEDSVLVLFEPCPERFCSIAFPDAFSPNKDGRNDVFRAITNGQFDAYALSVYDRWGKLLFISYKPEEGWDGTYNGVPVEIGVYMYCCQVSCPLKGTQLLKGDITVVR